MASDLLLMIRDPGMRFFLAPFAPAETFGQQSSPVGVLAVPRGMEGEGWVLGQGAAGGTDVSTG